MEKQYKQNTTSWIQRDEKVLWHGFSQMATFSSWEPVVVDSGKGHFLKDVDGKQYFDAISSLWVSTFGHQIPELDQAIIDQLKKIAHSTMLGNSNTTTIALSEALAKKVPVKSPHFLYASDGAAAVEQGLKIAFQYWINKGIDKKVDFVCLDEAYHGDTIGSLSLGAGGFGTEIFNPLRFGVLRASSYSKDPYLESVISLVKQKSSQLVAVVVEPMIQAASGMLMSDPKGLFDLYQVCKKENVLLVVDEVATGFGRTGTLFACEQAGIEPDILCLGKGITGGYLAMSATVVSQEVFDSFLDTNEPSMRTLTHGHSYGGNALAAAVALRHLDLIDQSNVLENVKQQSSYLLNKLQILAKKHPCISDIRFLGLMGGIEVNHNNSSYIFAKQICATSTNLGVLLRPLGNVIPLVLPLDISEQEIDLVIATIDKSIEQVLKKI